MLKIRIIINPSHILTEFNDPDPKKRDFLRRIRRYTHLLSFIDSKQLSFLLLSLILPITVSAGLVGSFSGIFFKEAQAGEELGGKNIQTMSLLAAAIAPLDVKKAYGPEISGDALIPNVGPSGSDASVSKPSSDQISVYVVRKGDTISQIAEMYDVSVNTVKWGNDLSSNTLTEGQTLVILPISGVKHAVAKGDTLASIAKKYKADADEIASYNNLPAGGSLAVGSVIIVPDGEAAPAQAPLPASRGGKPSSGKSYAGYYMRPLAGGIKTQGIHGYNGVDLGAPFGTPILAAADGDVIVSKVGGYNGGYGNYIVIKHDNGTQTLYAHNTSNSVSVGSRVSKGDVIGTVGSTGKSTGPHLHFEIRGARNPF